eukprot:TRINITY_DN5701_c0_g1_i2.p1 TRINITY_DN5701_c0_g1~~TRINITY_DN5701_c0_g1_i2.p1  ORF type:complete len:224 (+),score=40.60 TRINITY_DN5701_c0_g1_i2:72-674(+)
MAADWGGDSDAEGVYESLDTKDLEVEIQVGGRKRKYEEVAADEARQEEESFLKIVGDGEDATTVAADARGALAGEGGFAADVEDSEDEGCQLVVCHDKGAKAGGMAYYLGVNGTSSTAKADAEKTPEELKRLESTAEIVTQDKFGCMPTTIFFQGQQNCVLMLRLAALVLDKVHARRELCMRNDVCYVPCEEKHVYLRCD